MLFAKALEKTKNVNHFSRNTITISQTASGYRAWFLKNYHGFKGFLGGSDSKEPACSAGDPGSIPGSGRSEKEMVTHSSILAWKIPWMEDPGRLQSMGVAKSWT